MTQSGPIRYSLAEIWNRDSEKELELVRQLTLSEWFLVPRESCLEDCCGGSGGVLRIHSQL